MLVSCAAWVFQLSDWRSSYAVGSSRTTRESAGRHIHDCNMVMVGMGLLGCGSGTYGSNWHVVGLVFGSVQRKFQEEDIRVACQRLMPETAERCFDTVVIQRGGVWR